MPIEKSRKTLIGVLIAIIVILLVIISYFVWQQGLVQNLLKNAYTNEKISTAENGINTAKSCKSIWNGLKESWIEESSYQTKMALNSEVVGGKGAGGEADSHTGTNNQVEGVDEGDTTKFDGEFLYTHTTDDSFDSGIVHQISINQIDKQNGKITNKGKISFSSQVSNVYSLNLVQNKLIVILGVNDTNQSPSVPYDMVLDKYGYTTNYTKVLIYNVNNKEDIKLEKDFRVDGYFKTSRTIGNKLYLVANYDNNQIYPLLKENRDNDDKINQILTNYLPYVGASDSYSKSLDCSSLQYVYPLQNTSITNLVGLDLADYTINNKTIMGATDNIYVSNTNMYLTSANYYSTKTDRETTNIYKYDLNKGQIELTQKGVVDGLMINQFAMDEKDGNLRVATTVRSKNQNLWNLVKPGEMPNNEDKQTSGLYILDGDLKVKASKTDLANGEKIYAVRFSGNRAYVVTFKQVDPLFVFDLSNIEEVKLLGELKVPGYSTYLHPVGEELLIGIGQDTKEIKSTVGTTTILNYTNNGVKVSLFDVKDPANPVEIDVKLFGANGSFSQAEYEHKAFAYLDSEKLFALPVVEYSASNSGEWSGQISKSGSYVFDVSNKKLQQKSYITHITNPITEENSYSKEVYGSYINRQYFLNNFIVTVSNNYIQTDNYKTGLKYIDKVQI